MAMIEYAEQCRKGGMGTHRPDWTDSNECDYCERRIVLVEKIDGQWLYMDWILVTEWP